MSKLDHASPGHTGTPAPTLRILVTGSRTWEDADTINKALAAFEGQHTLITGNAKGADALAESYAIAHGWNLVLHPADWAKHGKRAGYLRNKRMVEQGADVCLAFIKDHSRGATMCADLAEREGINVYRWVRGAASDGHTE